MEEGTKTAESIGVELEIDSIIYYNEFERHYQEYRDNKTSDKADSELIFIFIALQIYAECFLHQNMRKIIELEFKHASGTTNDDWLNGEKRFIPEKLDAFHDLFLKTPSSEVKTIKENFGKLSYARNLFAHGHKVATWSDSDGNHGISAARSLLTDQQLEKSISEINKMGNAWNKLLDDIAPQLQHMRQTAIASFKFSEIVLDKVLLSNNFNKKI